MKRIDFSPLRGRRPWLGLGFALCAGVSGCNVIPAAQTDPTKFYVLSAPAAGPSESTAASGDHPLHAVRIGLKNVDVATYLKDPPIVVRSGSNQVAPQDYARWAEPLQAGLTRLLREQLAQSGRVSRIDVQPFPLDQELDYVVSVSILHCEGAAGGADGKAARFEASIRVTRGGVTPEIVARKISGAPNTAWDGHDFDALARLLSADVQGLGEAILAALP
jgi:uncharacterized lipoprotein YmbA